MAPTEKAGIAPGWRIVDVEWTTVLERHERRAVEKLVEHVDDEVFACYQRWGNELEFDFIGWVASYEDAEQWLAGRIPASMAVRGHPAIQGLNEGAYYGNPQRPTEDA